MYYIMHVLYNERALKEFVDNVELFVMYPYLFNNPLSRASIVSARGSVGSQSCI